MERVHVGSSAKFRLCLAELSHRELQNSFAESRADKYVPLQLLGELRHKPLKRIAKRIRI